MGAVSQAAPMLTHPQFDPILFSIGPLAIRWYGLMYVVAFVSFLMLTKLRVKRGFGGTMTVNDVDDLLLYGVLGVILGGAWGTSSSTRPASTSRTRLRSSRCGRVG